MSIRFTGSALCALTLFAAPAAESAKPAGAGVVGRIAMVRISAGEFDMGSPESETGRYPEEGPRHRVRITRPFDIMKHEVTQAEWRETVGNNPSQFIFCGESCPVENVTWWDALYYANAVSRAAGVEECYQLSGCTGRAGEDLTCASAAFKGPVCKGYRLPTEAEWEYAARAGGDGPLYTGSMTALDGRNAPELDAIAWYGGNSAVDYEGADCSGWKDTPKPMEICGPHAVGGKAASRWGLQDTQGNVFEWVWDRYGSYASEAVADPTGPTAGKDRVNRGGSWGSRARYCRSAFRNRNLPGYRSGHVGFRLVKTAG